MPDVRDEDGFREELSRARRSMLHKLQSPNEELNIDEVNIDLTKLEGLRAPDLEKELNEYLVARLARETLSRGFSQTHWNRKMWWATMLLASATVILAISTVVLAVR